MQRVPRGSCGKRRTNIDLFVILLEELQEILRETSERSDSCVLGDMVIQLGRYSVEFEK